MKKDKTLQYSAFVKDSVIIFCSRSTSSSKFAASRSVVSSFLSVSCSKSVVDIFPFLDASWNEILPPKRIMYGIDLWNNKQSSIYQIRKQSFEEGSRRKQRKVLDGQEGCISWLSHYLMTISLWSACFQGRCLRFRSINDIIHGKEATLKICGKIFIISCQLISSTIWAQ